MKHSEQKQNIICPKCGSSQHYADSCISRAEFNGTDGEFNKLYDVRDTKSKQDNDIRHELVIKECETDMTTRIINIAFGYLRNHKKFTENELLEFSEAVHDKLQTLND